MDEFLTYVSAFDPDFRVRIEGATQAEIDEFEAVSGHTLPQFYKDFLRAMGHKDARYLSDQDILTDVQSLLTYYREDVASGEDENPEDCVTIATSGVSIEKLCLEVAGVGRLWHCDLAVKEDLWAESLENWLYLGAYMRHRPRAFAHSGFFSAANHTRVLEWARAEALRLGFEEQWFSDQVAFCGETKDAALIIHQIKGYSPSVKMGANDEHQIESFIERIAQATGVKLKKQTTYYT